MTTVNYKEVNPTELHERLRRGDEVLVVDVREPAEHALAHVEGARLLPLSQFNEWAGALDPEAEIVFMCHHGVRSAQICAYLAREGFHRLSNLTGGIDRWSAEVDVRVPRY